MLLFIRFDSIPAGLLARWLFRDYPLLLLLTVFVPSSVADAVFENKNVGGEMSAFEPWIGQMVVVQLTLGRIKLSLRGTLLKDRRETLLVRPEVGSDVEVLKANVLAIEEAGRHCAICPTLAI